MVEAVTSPEPTADEIELERHRAFAVEANNSAWELLGLTADNDVPVLTLDQTFDLLSRAYAAAHHWRAVTGPASINAARAAWLCSRCHAVVGDGEAALRMAELCASLTAAADDAADFDHFYAGEARARAMACLGRKGEAAAAHRDAKNLLADLTDAEDREIAAADLEAGPWFGFGDLVDGSP